MRNRTRKTSGESEEVPNESGFPLNFLSRFSFQAYFILHFRHERVARVRREGGDGEGGRGHSLRRRPLPSL